MTGKKHEHIVKSIMPGSIAEELGIEPGDKLLSIDGQEIEDIFDYQFYVEDEEIVLLIEKQDGEQWELEIEKDADEQLGIEFGQGLMDEYRSCRNKCMFCFIDQMPEGMRDTLYFKDDDSRLSFLQGNYGAGMGATVGKYMGRERSMKSGIGAYAVQLGELKVGAVVTLNALGDIYDIDTDKKIAGALDENGLLFDDETAYFEAAAKIQNMFTGNTTIGTIITNAKLDKTALGKVASMAHNGYGRAIRPVHTMADGDSIYAVSVGSVPADINLVGPMSAYVMAKAIANAARSAKSVDGYKAFCDVNKK